MRTMKKVSMANKYPPNVLAVMIEEELLKEFKNADSTVYKSSANNVIKRLTGNRFEEARRQLSEGEFQITDFIKGETPKASSRKPQPIRNDAAPQATRGMAPTNIVNRNRGITPPFANRGGRGAPRGAPMGARGRGAPMAARGRGAPMRGGFNPSRVEQDDEINEEETEQNQEQNAEENKEIKETKIQQPATKLPVEPLKKVEGDAQVSDREHSKEIEESKASQSVSAVNKIESPKVREAVQHPAQNSSDQDEANISDNMPKPNHRRGQPPTGNLNAPPPMANRGRVVKAPRSNVIQKPSAPLFNLATVDRKAEEENKEEQKEEESETEVVKQSIQTSSFGAQNEKVIEQAHAEKEQEVTYDLDQTTNYQESENKKREIKAMFGKMFENETSESNEAKARGRSPNFSDQRYGVENQFAVEEDPPISNKSQPNVRKVKTHRKHNDLNKSVEIFGGIGERYGIEPLVQDQTDALNASFGVENTSTSREDLIGGDSEQSNPMMFASSFVEDTYNRSKTPPVDARRTKLEHHQIPKGEYHKAIGAKEDFIIEEPILEDNVKKEEPKKRTPEIKPIEYEDREPSPDKDSINIPSPVMGNQNINILSEPKVQKQPPVTSRNKQPKSLMTENIEENKSMNTEFSNISAPKAGKSNLNPSLSGQINNFNIKGLNATGIDKTIAISHTSSVKSLPDETERLNENLRAKKQECEELKQQLEERENELKIQQLINEELKQELNIERNRNQQNQQNSKLEKENKELWEMVKQLKHEQKLFKVSLLSAFNDIPFAMESIEIDQSNMQSIEENKEYEEVKQPRPESVENEYYRNFIQSQRVHANREDTTRFEKFIPRQNNRHFDIMTQEMMNNAAGSGSNQDDFMLQDKPNEGEDDEEVDYDEEEDDYNEEGTSGGDAKHNTRGEEFKRYRDEFLNDILDNEGRIIQGNERRGRQKQGKKKRGNKNTRETGRDSGDDYEEEKIPIQPSSSSGIQPHSYK